MGGGARSAAPIVCEQCQGTNPAGFRYCGICGAPLPQHWSAGGARKVVTILFCDVAGSTELGESLDPEALRDVLGRFFEDADATIRRHGGAVQKYAGDAVLAVFGIPRVHEDDALRAVRAALEIRERLPLLAEEIGLELTLRMGVNTGLVMTDEGRTLALGDSVNIAARLEQAAAPAEILLGDPTLRLVRDVVEAEPLEPLVLKGKSDPVPAYRLIALRARPAGAARRLDLPLVDREREMVVLNSAWRQAVQERRCQVVTLVGSPGLGKSRLAEEICRAVSNRTTVLRGRCLHYGEGITFWPLIEAFGDAGPTAEGAVRQLSEGGGTSEELFLAIRLMLEALARRRPVILYLDDLQWAEPMLIELLGQVAEMTHDAPLLLLCTARPELWEAYPGWGTGAGGAVVLDVEPLPEADCRRLVEHAGSPLDEPARAEILRISEGNPLFIEEMIAVSLERGSVDLPPTIQSLLASRIESLAPAEQELLACGAVEGKAFHRSALCTLIGADDSASEAEVDEHLASLVRKDLIRPSRAMLPGDEAFAFRHQLIRDSAYERVPRAHRAELHDRLAAWLESRGGLVPEHEELIGWHLERVISEREQVRRPVTEATRLRAARHLHAAARHAADRGDMVASRKLLERGLDLTPPAEPLRVNLLAELADRLLAVGDLSQADELLTATERAGSDEVILSLRRLEWLTQARPDEAARLYEARCEPMRAELAAEGDELGLAGLHMVGFWVHWLRSQATAAGRQARLAAEQAAAAGDLAMRSRALGWYVVTLMYGPQPMREISVQLRWIEQDDPGPYLQAFLLMGQAEVHRLAGRFEEAVAHGLSSVERLQALGLPILAGGVMQFLATIEMGAGDLSLALQWLQRSDALLAEAGEQNLRSTTLATVAQISAMLGSTDEARAALEKAEELSSSQDLLNLILAHDVRARLARAAGDHDEAERWARSALAYALRTEFSGHQAQAHVGLAHALMDAGRRAEAETHARAACELFAGKEDLPGLASAEALLQTD